MRTTEIKIKAEAKEIADLVFALQGQRWNREIKSNLDQKAFEKATHDRLQEGQ